LRLGRGVPRVVEFFTAPRKVNGTMSKRSILAPLGLLAAAGCLSEVAVLVDGGRSGQGFPGDAGLIDSGAVLPPQDGGPSDGGNDAGPASSNCILNVSPTSLDFGQVRPGLPAGPLNVTISNAGLVDCLVQNLGLTDSWIPPFGCRMEGGRLRFSRRAAVDPIPRRWSCL
jgi:hypothetical protein